MSYNDQAVEDYENAIHALGNIQRSVDFIYKELVVHVAPNERYQLDKTEHQVLSLLKIDHDIRQELKFETAESKRWKNNSMFLAIGAIALLIVWLYTLAFYKILTANVAIQYIFLLILAASLISTIKFILHNNNSAQLFREKENNEFNILGLIGLEFYGTRIRSDPFNFGISQMKLINLHNEFVNFEIEVLAKIARTYGYLRYLASRDEFNVWEEHHEKLYKITGRRLANGWLSIESGQQIKID